MHVDAAFSRRAHLPGLDSSVNHIWKMPFLYRALTKAIICLDTQQGPWLNLAHFILGSKNHVFDQFQKGLPTARQSWTSGKWGYP